MGQSLPDLLQDLQGKIVTLEALMSRTRHDVRSALAPAMLAADLMRASPDPRTQRSGDTVVRAIERVLDSLDATREVVPPRPGQAALPRAPVR